MRIRNGLLALCCAMAVVSCGGDDDPAVDTDAQSTSPASSTPAPAQQAGGNTTLPDPCLALTNADYASAFGKDPGTGTKTTVVNSRSICSYSSGLILGISEGDQYADFDKGVYANTNAKCSPVSDVGEKATFCVVYGSVGQFIFLDGKLMYDFTGPAKEVAPYKALAAKLLA